MATSAESKKMITLRSSDGYEFEIEENVAMQSETIKFMIEDDCAESVIPLTNVNSKILSKVIEYCKKHVESTYSKSDDKTADEELKAGDADFAKVNLTILSDLILSEELKEWDADFVKVDLTMLGNLMLAANFLHIKSLLDLLCKTVADMIKGKNPDEIRKTFNIENDFSPEVEEEVCWENQWVFE